MMQFLVLGLLLTFVIPGLIVMMIFLYTMVTCYLGSPGSGFSLLGIVALKRNRKKFILRFEHRLPTDLLLKIKE